MADLDGEIDPDEWEPWWVPPEWRLDESPKVRRLIEEDIFNGIVAYLAERGFLDVVVELWRTDILTPRYIFRVVYPKKYEDRVTEIDGSGLVLCQQRIPFCETGWVIHLVAPEGAEPPIEGSELVKSAIPDIPGYRLGYTSVGCGNCKWSRRESPVRLVCTKYDRVTQEEMICDFWEPRGVRKVLGQVVAWTAIFATVVLMTMMLG